MSSLRSRSSKISKILLQGPVPRKMVKFNPGLSLVLSEVFLLRICNLSYKQSCCAFTPRYHDDNKKGFSTQHVGK